MNEPASDLSNTCKNSENALPPNQHDNSEGEFATQNEVKEEAMENTSQSPPQCQIIQSNVSINRNGSSIKEEAGADSPIEPSMEECSALNEGNASSLQIKKELIDCHDSTETERNKSINGDHFDIKLEESMSENVSLSKGGTKEVQSPLSPNGKENAESSSTPNVTKVTSTTVADCVTFSNNLKLMKHEESPNSGEPQVKRARIAQDSNSESVPQPQSTSETVSTREENLSEALDYSTQNKSVVIVDVDCEFTEKTTRNEIIEISSDSDMDISEFFIGEEASNDKTIENDSSSTGKTKRERKRLAETEEEQEEDSIDNESSDVRTKRTRASYSKAKQANNSGSLQENVGNLFSGCIQIVKDIFIRHNSDGDIVDRINLQSDPPESSILVRFHVFISKKFYFQNKSVYIIFGDPVGDWRTAMVEMQQKHLEIHSNDKLLYLCGSYSFKRKICNQRICYKYAIFDQEKGKFEWEYFEEEYHGIIFNRFWKGSCDHPSPVNKYDDWITNLRYNKSYHSSNREKALAYMAFAALDFEKNSFESVMDTIESIYQAYDEQYIVDSGGTVRRFGSNYKPYLAILCFCDICTPLLEDSSLKSFQIAAAITVILGDKMDGKCTEFKRMGDLIEALFKTFKLFATRLQSADQLKSTFKLSADFQPTFLLFLCKTLDIYLTSIRRCSTLAISPCVYAYSVIRSLQNTDEDYAGNVNFNILRGLPYYQKQTMREALDTIVELPDKSELFKYEYLQLCSPKLLKELLSSDYLHKFSPTMVFDRFCYSIKNKDLVINEMKTPISASETYFVQGVQQLDVEGIAIWQDHIENSLLCNRTCRIYELTHFSLVLLITMKERIDSQQCLKLSNLSGKLIEVAVTMMKDLLLSSTGQLDYGEIACRWSQCFDLLNQLKPAEYFDDFLKSFQEIISKWLPGRFERQILPKLSALNATVFDLILDSMFKDNSSSGNSIFSNLWDYINGDSSHRTTNRNKGLLLSRMILSFDKLTPPNEISCVKVFVQATESDYLVKVLPSLSKYETYVSQSAAERLTSMKDNLDYFLKLLESGELTFKVLNYLSSAQRKERFIQLLPVLSSRNDQEMLLKLRLEESEHVRSRIECIKKYFDDIEINRKAKLCFDNYINFDEENSLLKTFCMTRKIHCSSLNTAPKLLLHSLSGEQMEVMSRYVDFLSSFCFRKMLADSVVELNSSVWQLPDAVNHSKLITNRFFHFCEMLSAGSLPLTEVQNYFSKHESNEVKLKEELVRIEGFINRQADWISDILKKMKLFFAVSTLKSMTETLLETVDILKIECDCAALYRIIDLSGGDSHDEGEESTLAFLNADMLAYKDMFSSWSANFLTAMRTLNKCVPLIDWVRKNIESVQALKVFIDLANISAGETDIEVDRVLCFQSSVMAYSGFLFDCRGECSLEQLFHACGALNTALERGENIARKLLDSNRHIRWLDTIKDRHGSVETSSLNLVTLINEYGEIHMKVSKLSCSLVTANITFEEKHGNESYKRTLSLNDLKELESKLMLISVNPDVKIQVHRFTSLLHQIILMQKSIEQLLIAGCCLFSQLSIKGFFSRKERVSVRLDFGHKTGILTGSSQLEKEFSAILSLLDKCVTKWEAYVMTLRTDYHLLNFYTTDQLVVLSRFISDIENNRQCAEREPLMLLQLLSSDIDMDAVKSALRSNSRTAPPSNSVVKEEMVEESDVVMADCGHEKSHFDLDEVKELVATVSSTYGCTEGNILACIVQMRGVRDTEAIAKWCFDNENQSVTVEDFRSIMEEQQISETETKMEPDCPDLDAEPTEEDQFQTIQKLIETIHHDHGIEAENIFAAMLATQNVQDEDSLVRWCFENPDFKEEISMEKLIRDNLLQRVSASNPDQNHVEMSESSTLEITEPISKVSNKIETMWKRFLQSTRIDDAQDLVTFKRLNDILKSLYSEHFTPPKRAFPPFLEAGKPNLIVVKQSALHETALMLYELDEEKYLPGLDEILICDNNTTLEQLVLHCLRAFNDVAGKIYTFLHADRINFDNSCHLEKLFVQPVANHDYHLVFLSSKEQDDQSYIANALLRYRANVPHMTHSNDLRVYLQRQLQRKKSEASVGYQVDPEMSRMRIISSKRSGEGKSLLTHRISEHVNCSCVTLPVHTEQVETDELIATLFARTGDPTLSDHIIFHIDLYANIRTGVQDLLFSLSVMSGVRDYKGKLWICSSDDYYLIEMLMISDEADPVFQHLLPLVMCGSPQESFNFYQSHLDVPEVRRYHHTVHDGLCHFMDYKTCCSEDCQRPYQYLDQFVRQESMDQFVYNSERQKNLIDCLRVLLHSCCVTDPTWMELSNFWKFLNVQLTNCEKSVFCNFKFVGDTLPGFKNFVVKFMIQMSKDIATRSAIVTDESMAVPRILERHSWEKNSHPYLFFNEDGQSLCFFGFKIRNGHLIDDRNPAEERIIEENIMGRDLLEGLRNQKINFSRNLSNKGQQKLRKFYLTQLRKVFGLRKIKDSDLDYELTCDNVLKMLAIYMRFRADIPVMIMGETGTGKTRLIRFICDLQRQGHPGNNMVVVKCHGGIESKDIYRIVNKTIDLARDNMRTGIRQTVLFFDEANTTSAIGAIKEVMCDKMVDGVPIPDNIGIKFVAAVNPYREHSQKMISKLESAGLGYHMKAENSEDTLGGRIPMRRLVYRVKEMPPSILPFIWDFGKLDDLTERKYVTQMVEHRVAKRNWSPDYEDLLVATLTTCQRIMRDREDECSFVSLRDVDRCLEILWWFSTKEELIINPIIEDILAFGRNPPDAFAIQLILAVACAYYVRLEERTDFFPKLQPCFAGYDLDSSDFHVIIDFCQELFIKELRLDPTISRNEALKENIWIMAICIELKIPLFLVGKPGSSKSLAKTLVGDVMQGEASYSVLFKHFKEIQLVSFQCSPLATADGILSTFRQCQTYQKKQNLDTFTSVVVLDEIGLAEDSRKMPLKTLHPLLEDGCVGEEVRDNYKTVGFIGISNWALDPAKMNRGIFVSRGKLSKKDLLKTARGICPDDEEVRHCLEEFLEDIVDAYEFIYETQEREYYGLRDFYNLIKMLYQIYKANETVSIPHLKRAIYRCFGGSFGELKAAEVFISKMKCIPIDDQTDRDMDHFDLVKSALTEREDNRYLLLLTKNNAALRILLENGSLFNEDVSLIFGSSFPHDQEYMQLCKNINRIKLAMEMGHTVILCNLSNLYESLYDALNQSYVYMGGSRYVDLGLGMHRVKCRVHYKFRLIVVAEDKDVFERFPIPLINRLEKHYLGMESLMSSELRDQQTALQQWIHRFAEINEHGDEDFIQYTPEDVFIGFHRDVTASLIIQTTDNDRLKDAKRKLISCASPDSISRLAVSSLTVEEMEEVTNVYHLEQEHTSLAALIHSLQSVKHIFLQVTTHSRPLTLSSKEDIAVQFGVSPDKMKLISIQQVETEDQFRSELDEFFIACSECELENVLIVQSSLDMRTQRSNLIECARYCVKLAADRYQSKVFALVLLIQIPRIQGGSFIGFSFHPWQCIHLDEIHSDERSFNIDQLRGKSVSEIVELLDEAVFTKLIVAANQEFCAKIESVDNERGVTRILTLHSIIKSSRNGPPFLNTLKAKLIESMKKLESKQASPKEFLVDVSMHSVYLREGHTFQQALWLTLLNKMGPLFMRLIKLSDVGQGLNHLATSDTDDWIQRFFTQVLLILDVDQVAMPQLVRPSSLPFSWAVFDLLEKIYSTGRTMGPDTFYCAMKETQLGIVLNTLFETNGADASRLFVKDFISMKYPVMSEHPPLMEVLIDKVIKIADKKILQERIHQFSMNDMKLEKIVMASDLYLTICQIYCHQMKTLTDAISFWDTLSGRPIIEAIVAENPDKEIDRIAIDAILKLLEPKDIDPSNDKDRKQWIRNVKRFGLIIQRYFSYQPVTEECDLKLTYQRLEILTLFAEYVVGRQLNDKFTKILRQSFNRLRIMVKQFDNMKDSAAFDRILSILSRMSGDTGRLIFSSGVDKCFLCDKQLHEPVPLPCEHVACWHCLRDTAMDRSTASYDATWNCPFENCSAVYRADCPLKSSWQCTETVELHRQFRDNMNIFFLEILHRYTFAGDTAPDEAVIETLLQYVLPQKEESITTRQLTPFQSDCVDATPTIRSFIFQLILRGQRDLTRIDHFLNKFFTSASSLIAHSPSQTSEFFLLVLYSIEDFVLSKSMKKEGDLSLIEATFFNELTAPISVEAVRNMTLLKKLEFTAKLRISLSYAAQIIHRVVTQQHNLRHSESEHMETIREMMSTLSQDCLFKYLVKEITEKYSRETILEWRHRDDLFLNMMPESLRHADLDHVPDYFSVIGRNYKQIKGEISKMLQSPQLLGNMATPEDRTELMQWRMASFHLKSKLKLDTAVGQTAEELISQLEKKQLRIVSHHSSLLHHIRTTTSSIDKVLYSLVYHVSEMLRLHSTTRSRGVLELFYQLCYYPEHAVGAYFPTMPQDELVDILNTMHTPSVENQSDGRYFKLLYRCRNGHPYGVADCGALNERGRCPCGAAIGGGTNSQAEATSTTRDNTQTGHMLGPAISSQMISGVRQLNSVLVAVIRFLIHAAMLLCKSKQSLVPLIVPAVAVNEMESFLMRHLRHNFTQLTRALGRSEDHTRLYLHSLIDHFTNYQPPNGALLLNSKQNRLQWEYEFSQHALNGSNLDSVYEEFQHAMTMERQDSQSLLNCVLQYEETDGFDVKALPFVNQLWKPRVRISLANINCKIDSAELDRRCPLLSLMIQHETILSKTHHLISILKLQSILVERFDKKIDPSVLENVSIQEFLLVHIIDFKERELLKEWIDIYLVVFNQLRYKLFAYHEAGRSARHHYVSVDATCGAATQQDSRCGILFPSSFGFGLCAVMLVQLLIDSHNTALRRYLSQIDEEEEVAAVSPCIVDQSQLVALGESRELEMLLLVNSRYSLQCGRATEWSIDLNNLERHVENRFFVGRVLLDNKSVPRLSFTENKETARKVSLSIPQSVLPSPLQNMVEMCLPSLPDICRLLNDCQTIRNILVITTRSNLTELHISEKSSLKSYIHILKFRTLPHILASPILENVILEQMDDLIVFLKVVRAKRMIRLRQNPWQGLLKPEMQMKIERDVKLNLNSVLHHIPPTILLTRLFRFIEEYVTTGHIDNPNFPISDCIYEFLFELNENDLAELFKTYFPPEALVQHSSNCFSYFVQQIENKM